MSFGKKTNRNDALGCRRTISTFISLLDLLYKLKIGSASATLNVKHGERQGFYKRREAKYG
jgi:hypothetical protein